MSTEGSGASSASRSSSVNEDAYLAHDGLGLYVVCDGASEGPAGEVAAATALAALERFVAEGERKSGVAFLRSFASNAVALAAVKCAMRAVIEASERDSRLDGMATTVSVLLAHRHRASICHVGDSRVYMVRNGYIHQITSDHELSVDAGTHSGETYEAAELECFSIDLVAGDTFLLCSDGAEDVVEDHDVLGSVADTSPQVLADRIIQAANRRHPDRDATAVVVRVRDDEEPGWLWLSGPARAWAFGHTVRAT